MRANWIEETLADCRAVVDNLPPQDQKWAREVQRQAGPARYIIRSKPQA